MQLELLY